jgi:2-polyprenyl-6-methoxyphenol hydroxylase-like FAD-dependent oxidoreductase
VLIVRTIGDHAVVAGASMGGLLAARVLAEAYDRVTIVERDVLPPPGQNRKGVPQGRHAHALLPRGVEIFTELFPGLIGDLVAGGAPVCELLSQVRCIFNGHVVRQVPAMGLGVMTSRPFLEGHLRARVQDLCNVEIVERCDVVGVVPDDSGSKITGARVFRRTGGSAEEVLTADLVVDATGRASRLPAWLGELGYQRAPQEEVRIDVGYASRYLRLRPGALGRERAVYVSNKPDQPRGMALYEQEGERWILTLHGYWDHHPPADPGDFLAFAATMAPPDVLAAIKEAEPLGEIVAQRFPANVRRHYERLDAFPTGLLVFGDALCVFNPVYGQGMSVAGLEALALRHCLADGERELARRFFRAAAKVIDFPWLQAAGGDSALSGDEGSRTLPVRMAGAYMARFRAAAETDGFLENTFMRVSSLLDPPSHLLRRPSVALRLAGQAISLSWCARTGLRRHDDCSESDI